MDPTDDSPPAPRVVQLLQTNGRAAWSVVGILVAIGLIGYVFSKLQLILFAIFVALVHAAIVRPVAAWWERRGLGRQAAAALALGIVVLTLGGATGLVGYRLVDQLPDVVEDVRAKRGVALNLLAREPLGMTEDEVTELLDRGMARMNPPSLEAQPPDTGDADATESTGGDDGEDGTADDGEGPSPRLTLALLAGGAAGLRLLGFALVGVVLSFFLVRDRDRITNGVVRHLAGGPYDERARDVLRAASQALDGYVRASVMVGAVEAALIGLTLLVVGTPLAGALTMLTFGAAFVPVVGATVAGLLAVVVTWVGVGGVEALIVGVVVIVVQQVDSNILQPAMVANHTHLHPIATILALLVGGLVGGVLGALLAVPTTAVLVAVTGELLSPGDPP